MWGGVRDDISAAAAAGRLRQTFRSVEGPRLVKTLLFDSSLKRLALPFALGMLANRHRSHQPLSFILGPLWLAAGSVLLKR